MNITCESNLLDNSIAIDRVDMTISFSNTIEPLHQDVLF